MGKSGAGSKGDTAVKLVLVFFIAMLSFSVGTYVGKQVSDSERNHAALETEYGQENHGESTEHAANHDDATTPVTDEQASSLAKEFVDAERGTASEGDHAEHKEDAHGEAAGNNTHAEHKEETHGEAAGHDTHASTNDHAEKKNDDMDGYTHHSKMKAGNHESAMAEMEKPHENQAKNEQATDDHNTAHDTPTKSTHSARAQHDEKHEPSPAAARVAKDLAPAADAKKSREPSSVLPSVATTAVGKFTVQVASYATETEAKSQAEKLTGKGYSAFYVPAMINGKSWYRVSIGLFSDHKSATNYRTELLATQAVSSAIVQKIVK